MLQGNPSLKQGEQRTHVPVAHELSFQWFKGFALGWETGFVGFFSSQESSSSVYLTVDVSELKYLVTMQ